MFNDAYILEPEWANASEPHFDRFECRKCKCSYDPADMHDDILCVDCYDKTMRLDAPKLTREESDRFSERFLRHHKLLSESMRRAS